MKTRKLYYENAYINEFEAEVLEVTQAEADWLIVLDKTAFFPEGGGQAADTGFIADAEVLDVRIIGGEIYHMADRPLRVGQKVLCKLNFAERFLKMQIHTGEHIVSGVMNNMLGLSNVGFHLGEARVTLDFDRALSAAEIAAAEQKANEIIYKNVPVKCYFPSDDELENTEYRSKKELDGDIRLVKIEGHDICACCAPHVAHTGEVGLIKIIASEKLRGGSRLSMVCGQSALKYLNMLHGNNSQISNMLCAAPEDTAKAVAELQKAAKAKDFRIAELYKKYIAAIVGGISRSAEPIFIDISDFDIPNLRGLVNGALKIRPSVMAISGDDNDIRFVLAGDFTNDILNSLKSRFLLRGGGKEMVQGSIFAAKKDIILLFESLQIEIKVI